MATSTREDGGVELGFVEEVPQWKLSSKFFPSKVGGKPAWLRLHDLPVTAELLCGKCSKPCAFLLQVYAPVEGLERCFHRTVFLFVCTEPDCCARDDNRCFRAFRCQLPRDNDTYGSKPAEEDDEAAAGHPHAADFNALCVVCGCSGPYRCSKCHKTHYCSAIHQTMDWKAGHKRQCKDNIDGLATATTFLLKEYELVTEPEPEEQKKEVKTEAEAMDEYQSFLKSEKAKNMLTETDEAIENEIGDLAHKEDKPYCNFMKRIRREPEQVLRYQRGGQPLWVAAEHQPTVTDIPKCPCGAPREFEFQILPQLLNHLKLDKLENSIDWGTLAVYTCSKNCENGSSYYPEFVWKQDFSNSNNVPFM